MLKITLAVGGASVAGLERRATRDGGGAEPWCGETARRLKRAGRAYMLSFSVLPHEKKAGKREIKRGNRGVRKFVPDCLLHVERFLFLHGKSKKRIQLSLAVSL